MASAARPDNSSFGDLVRYWRRVRTMSQLDLASTAMTTPRHMSFLETGRARASRQMVLRLATALDVPLRDRNGLLLAAGFAPLYTDHELDDPQLERVTSAVGRILDAHDPLPAVAMNRRWDVLRTNRGASALFARLLSPNPIPTAPNVLRLMLEPGPVRAAVVNWDDVGPSLLERARREAVGGVLDNDTAELVQQLRTGPDASAFAAVPRVAEPLVPVIDVHFDVDGSILRWFSIVSTIGTPVDVTAQELRVEAFFPADDTTEEQWRRMMAPADRCA